MPAITTSDLFVGWEIDQEIDSSDWRDDVEPYSLWSALLFYGEAVVGSLGAIDFGPGGVPFRDPYADFVESELIAEFEAQRESMIERGTN